LLGVDELYTVPLGVNTQNITCFLAQGFGNQDLPTHGVGLDPARHVYATSDHSILFLVKMPFPSIVNGSNIAINGKLSHLQKAFQ
jgi:hypothetical protein